MALASSPAVMLVDTPAPSTSTRLGPCSVNSHCHPSPPSPSPSPPPPPHQHLTSPSHSHHLLRRNHHLRQSSPVPIADSSSSSSTTGTSSSLAHSPQSFRRVWTDGDKQDPAPSISPVRDLLEEEWHHYHTPSSPLLTAMREAVDSINQYEDFEILEEIGAGFFADVFKVRHIPTDQVMVLKLNKRMNGVKKMKEVELLKKLSHPNILYYYGACVYNGQIHPLTEYMNGGALEQLIQDLKVPLPMCLRLKLALDIARGMDYLHRHGMLHRDLNSKNCLLRKHEDSYTAVVADFGLAAKAPRVIRTLQRTQSVVGSPFWMAPEVLNGKSYDEKADVFSFGIILCELISRLESDPDELPRSKNFGLDEVKFRALPSVVESRPSEEFLSLTFHCCQVLPVERPDFTDLKVKLEIELGAGSTQHPPCHHHQVADGTPTHRLSHHHNSHFMIHNLDSSIRCSPPPPS